MFSGSIEGRLFPVPNKSLSALVKGCERVAAVHDHYGDGFFTLLIISTIFAVVYYVWAIANMISVSRSYLYVYDDHIEGVTTMGLTSSNVSFSLTYDQISQVETAKKTNYHLYLLHQVYGYGYE